MKKIKVGIIGCGNISEVYLKNCAQRFDMLEVTACAAIHPEHAKARAEQFAGVRAVSVEELLGDPEIDIVLNLTIPKAHHDICKAALLAGKNVYVEKPLSIERADARELLSLAASKNLRVGCAPDTFLGGGLQTCRKLIDEGWIGRPIAATAFMMSGGPEDWHPNPAFLYQYGAGPLFDMGPYYLTALVSLLGPVESVFAAQKKTFAQRTIKSEPKYGQKIDVEVPTYVSGLMNFQNGVVANLITSFDISGSTLPFIEIYGSEGTLCTGDPNSFGGPVRLHRKGTEAWSEIPTVYGSTDNARGLGLADMACAILKGRKHRANGEMAFHVLDVMHGFDDAATSGKLCRLESTCERPVAFPAGTDARRMDLEAN